MNRKSSSRQLVLFAAELPTWESLPQDRQQAVQEVLSLLLEQTLSQETYVSDHNSLEGTRKENHV